MTTKKENPTKKPRKNTPHDAFIKKVMENPVAAGEFLDEYLPSHFKAMIDLRTVKMEKESFVEKNLTKQLSDIVLSVQTREGDKAFVYILLEAQVKPDYLMALRLWKYTLLLCERHAKDKEKFPLVCPLVIYNGTQKYNAPMSLWELFADPIMAKSLLTSPYQLIDLQAMADDQINYDKHISMVLYMMKYINHRDDPLKPVDNMFRFCYNALIIDRQQDYVYMKSIIWYIDSRVPEEKKQELEQLIKSNLPEDSEDIMRTIAQAYIEEGEAKGEARGEAKLIKMMINNGNSIETISKLTGLSAKQVEELISND